MLLPIVGKRLVELAVFVLSDVGRITGPDGFGFIELLDVLVLFFDSFRLFLWLLFFISLIVFLYLLNLRLIVLEMNRGTLNFNHTQETNYTARTLGT